MMRITGLDCRLEVVEQSIIDSACLRRARPFDKSPVPDLVMYDLAVPSKQTIAIVRDIAFEERRSNTPVALLTSPASERLLDSGEIDGGGAIIFSPRSLARFLAKLAGRKRDTILDAVTILYRYGPFLIRQPEEFLDGHCADRRLSA